MQSQGDVEGELHNEASPEQADGPLLPDKYDEDYKVFYVEFQGRPKDDIDYKILATARSLQEFNSTTVLEDLESGEIQSPVNIVVNWINNVNGREAVYVTIDDGNDLERVFTFYNKKEYWLQSQDPSEDEESEDGSERLKVI